MMDVAVSLKYDSWMLNIVLLFSASLDCTICKPVVLFSASDKAALASV